MSTPNETKPPEGYAIKRRPVCLFSRNEVGSDTWGNGYVCQCDNCQAWAVGFNDGQTAQCEQLRGERDALRAENERLREWVEHRAGCQAVYAENGGRCTCGLSTALGNAQEARDANK